MSWGPYQGNTYMISTEHLHDHPENPRKDLGDLTELADSIHKNGLMQNLTVFPDPDHPDEYIILIGHRRAAAARIAGQEFVPCHVLDPAPERKEQLQIMLEENMQRSDLTPIEQAETFQLMLDLGDTIASIADRSGFSESTIRHRVKIAQLDKRILKKDRDWQLSISDLAELEKVKSVKKRNEILKDAFSSENLRSKIAGAAREEKREENMATLRKIFKREGWQEAPEGTSNQIWSGKWDTLEDIPIDDMKENPISDRKIKEYKKEAGDRQIFFYPYYSSCKILVKASKEKKAETEEERRQKERKKNERELKDILREIKHRFDDEIDSIVYAQRKPAKDPEQVETMIFEWLLHNGTFLSWKDQTAFFSEAMGGYNKRKSNYYSLTPEEKEAADKLGRSFSLMYRMLAAMAGEGPTELTRYMGEPNPESIKTMQDFCRILEVFGFSLDNEEWLQALDGTSPLYYKKEAKP